MDRPIVLAVLVVLIVVISLTVRVVSKRRHAIAQIDLADLGSDDPDPVVVVFTSPFCHGCRQWIDELEERELPAHAIDLAEYPGAAARYKINATPRVAVTSSRTGVVLKEFDHYTPRRHDLDAIERIVNAS